ncbi:MAG: hypothetical protein JNK82_15565 [Myxococcaceae bacterium]|nr:hypothetical protein [Myxococcaceae bacterium]
MKPTQKAALASLVASMFAAGCGMGADNGNNTNQQALVKCAGVNACAGQGACAGTLADGGMHDCAGKNACSGQGWVEIPKSECDSKGGTTIK